MDCLASAYGADITVMSCEAFSVIVVIRLSPPDGQLNNYQLNL